MYNESFSTSRLLILYAAYSYCIISPALSTLAMPCPYVHSCIFHTPIFDRAVLSTPANSIYLVYLY